MIKKITLWFLILVVVFLLVPINTLAEEETKSTETIETYLDAKNLSNNDKTLYRHPTYGIAYINISPTHQSTDYNVVVSSGDLVPGGSQTFNVSYTKTTQISTGGAIEAKQFNITIGVSQSESVTYGQSYSYTCPYKNGVKTVKSCTVTYYPKYQHYSFDKTLFGNYSSSGTSKVLNGFTQKVVFKY